MWIGIDTSRVQSSATGMAIQAPVMPRNLGRRRSAAVVNSRVLQKEMMAEVFPLDSAVKNPEDVMFNPLNRKLTAKSLKPATART